MRKTIVAALLALALAVPTFAVDKKISELTSGGAPTSGDLIPIDRSGANYSLDVAGFCRVANCTMTVPILHAAGLVSAPAVAFTGDATTGIYRIGAGNVGFASAGALVFDYNGSRVLSAVPILAPDGSVSLPGLAFGSNSAIGIFKSGNALYFARGSAKHLSWESNFGDDLGLPSTGRIGFSATSDPSAVSDVAIARGGVNILKITNGQSGSGILYVGDGAVGGPAYSYISDTTTGAYRIGASNEGFAAGGTLIYDYNGTRILTTVPVRTSNGSLSAPAFSFSGDTTTGMYKGTANLLDFTQGGTFTGYMYSQGWRIISTNQFGWLSGTTDANGVDTGLARSGAAFVKVTDGGSTNLGQLLAGGGSVTQPAIGIGNSGGTAVQNGFYSTGTNAVGYTRNGALLFTIGHALGTEFGLNSTMPINWSAGAATAAADVGIVRNGAAVIAFTNGAGTTGTGRIALADGSVGTNCAVGFNGGMCISATASPAMDIGTTASGYFSIASTFTMLPSSSSFTWSSGTIRAAGSDTGLARSGAGLVAANTGSGTTATGRFEAAAGAVGTPAFKFTGSATGIYDVGSGFLGIASSGNKALAVSSAEHILPAASKFNWSSTSDTSAARDTGIVRQNAGIVGITDGSSGAGALDVGNLGFLKLAGAAGNTAGFSQPNGADNSGFTFSPGNNGALSVGIFRRGNSASIELNGSGAATPSWITGWHQEVTANTGTATPTSKANSNYFYTNTGDGDGSIINLPDDPVVGTQYEVALTVAQTVTINANTGETIVMSGQTTGTHLAASAIGCTLRIVAVQGGSGGVWMVMSHEGTWTLT